MTTKKLFELKGHTIGRTISHTNRQNEWNQRENVKWEISTLSLQVGHEEKLAGRSRLPVASAFASAVSSRQKRTDDSMVVRMVKAEYVKF